MSRAGADCGVYDRNILPETDTISERTVRGD
jgi:hypothetical protein